MAAGRVSRCNGIYDERAAFVSGEISDCYGCGKFYSNSGRRAGVGCSGRNGALERAAELEERGQFAQVEQIHLTQERHFTENAEILFHLGTLRMRQNDWPKAIEYWVKCSALKPRNADVLFYLAQAQIVNSELVQTQKTILGAARLAPKEAPVLQKAGESASGGSQGSKYPKCR